MATADALVQALDQLYGVSNAAKLEFLRVLDQLDRTEGWREDGAGSLEDWVAFRYAMTWKAASDHVATMRALRGLPAIASVFGEGLLSWKCWSCCARSSIREKTRSGPSAPRSSTPRR